MEMIFMNTENSKTSKTHKFVLNLPNKNNQLKIITLTWND